ncbi:MAG: ribosome recycling factor [Candidatus Pacebacteria bacterium]|nr:ribosome recycling factor [Candidatus Paceibacterota bacterium]
MIYDFTKLKAGTKNIEDWLAKEFANIRAGAISATLLDNVKAENYGVLVPLNQMASVVTEDARTLRVNLWDVSQIKELETAIRKADLGASLSVDGAGLRLSFPELTGERRQLLVKMAKNKLEQAKISLRAERDKVWNEIKDKEKINEIGQDEKFQLKDEMQKIVDDTNAVLAKIFAKKEKEIMG